MENILKPSLETVLPYAYSSYERLFKRILYRNLPDYDTDISRFKYNRKLLQELIKARLFSKYGLIEEDEEELIEERFSRDIFEDTSRKYNDNELSAMSKSIEYLLYDIYIPKDIENRLLDNMAEYGQKYNITIDDLIEKMGG